jgi:hypothetical protein
MFSELTNKVFRFYFKYLSKWTSPLEWNDQDASLLITKNRFQLFRWKFISIFQMFYASFIWFRVIQSWFALGIPIREMVLQIPHFCMYSIAMCAEFTYLRNGLDLTFVYNQIAKNNRILSQHNSNSEKYDALGIILLYFLISVLLIPYFCASFFIANPCGKNFLYSISGNCNCSLTYVRRDTTFLIFILFEFLSTHVLCINCILLSLIMLFYSVYCRHWLKCCLERGEGRSRSYMYADDSYTTFRLLRIHTIRFNEVFSVFLVILKDFGSAFVIITTFTVIGLRKKLSLGFIGFMGFGGFTKALGLFAVFCPGGWVWRHSVGVKSKWHGKNPAYRRKYWAMRPFGIMIGSLYVVKTHTFITLFSIILNHVCTLLIASKRYR